MTEAAQIKLAAFRYRLIAEALEAPKAERKAELCKAAAKEYLLEDGTVFTTTLRTLQRWVKLYEKSSITGLTRQARKDRGKTRVVILEVINRLIELRKEGPSRSTPQLIDIVERAGEVAKGALKLSTVNRNLDHQGASRRMLHVLGTKRHIRMSFEFPFDFVVADFHHGPWVQSETDPTSVVRSKLGAFIDHASRYVPESRYGLREDVMAVRRGVRTLGTAHGLPRKLYVDNGSAYQSNRFHFGCGQLGIDLVHSKPYVSEGRGLIERFNRTVKEAFETEVNLLPEPLTLSGLNTFWHAWLDERYHRIPHSETNEPPLERWQRLSEKITFQQPDLVLLDEVFRLHARRTVHSKTSTVEVGALHFVVDTSLRKRRVDVLYDPHDLSNVLIYFEGKRIQRAMPQKPNEHPLPTPEATKPALTVNYLELLKRDYEKRRANELSSIIFKPVSDESNSLDIKRLLEQLKICTGHDLGEVECAQAAQVLLRLAPLEVSIADVALKAAATSLGCGLHASQYLTALTNHVLLARRQGSL